MPPRTQLLSLTVVSAVVVSGQILLTRLFAVVLQYEFVFLAVSLAILGLGVGALVFSQLRRPSGAADVSRALSFSGSALAVTLVISLAALVHWAFPFHAGKYWVAGLLVLVPFTCAGVFVAAAFSRWPLHSGRLCAAQLAGAALGAVAAMVLLNTLGALSGILVVAFLAAGAARACAEEPVGRRLSEACAVAVAMICATQVAFGTFELGPAPAGSYLFQQLGYQDAPSRILHTEWSAVARTDVVSDPDPQDTRSALMRDTLAVYTDGRSPTHMLRIPFDLRTSPVSTLEPLRDRVPKLAELAFSLLPVDRVLSLGPGGGRDVVAALLAGSREVEGAELNPSIPGLMRRFADYNGHLYEMPGVKIVTSEARSYLARSDRPYDVIVGALALPVGAGPTSLLDSYLYTIEAFTEYWKHLSQDGRLVLITHVDWLLNRHFATALAVLSKDRSRQAALGHLVAIGGGDQSYNSMLILKKSPFTRAEGAALAARAQALGLSPLFIPHTVKRPPFDRFPAMTLEEFTAGFGSEGGASALDFEPCTDLKPFCFASSLRQVPKPLVTLSLGVGALALLFAAVAWARGRWHGAGQATHWRYLLFASGLGMAFMWVEVPLIQALTLPLGYSTLAMSVVVGGLLVGASVGSWSAGAVGPRLSVVALGAALATGLAAAALPFLASGLVRWEVPAVVATVAVPLFALGFFLGMPFPRVLQLAARGAGAEVSMLLGLNGLMSVVGALLAAIIARQGGFGAVIWLGAGLYLLLAAGGYRLERGPRK